MPLHNEGKTYAFTLLVNDPDDPSKTKAYFPKTYAEGILLDATNPDKTIMKHLDDKDLEHLHLNNEIRNLLDNLGKINGILKLDENGYIPDENLPRKFGLLQYEFNTFTDLLKSNEFTLQDKGRLVSVKEMGGFFGINGWATVRLIGNPKEEKGWMWVWTMMTVDRTADWSMFTPLFRSTIAQIDAMVKLSHVHTDYNALSEFTEDDEGNLYYKDIKIPDRNAFRSLIITYSSEGIDLLPGDVGIAITNSREKVDTETVVPVSKIEVLSGDCTGLYKGKNILTGPKIDTKNVTKVTSMFEDCEQLNSTYHYDFSNVEYSDNCFKNCKSLVGVTDFGEDSLISAISMYENSGITYHPGMVAPLVKNLSKYFANSRIKYFGDFTAPMVEDMRYFASNCGYLKESGVLNIPNCVNLSLAFTNCILLEKVSRINSKRVKTFNSLFKGCVNLRDVDYIDFSSAEDTSAMFEGCTSLSSLKIIHGSLTTGISLRYTKLSIDSVIQLLIDAGQGNGNEIDIRNTPASIHMTDEVLTLANNKGWVLTYIA